MRTIAANLLGLMRKLSVLLATTTMLVIALFLSVVLFVYLAIIAIAIWGYWRWKVCYSQKGMARYSYGGRVIEGEVIATPKMGS